MKHILSLGAGVQSSTLALMAAKGEVTPMPEAAVFADTQAEPLGVYEWLNWLEKQLPFPVIRVTAGSLATTSTTPKISKRSGLPYLPWSIPAFTVNVTTGKRGMMFRQCTDKTKLTPLRRELKRLADGQPATIWIGISVDEAIRMKDSKDAQFIHRWPLIEGGVSRADCLKWMASHNYPVPPRSACTFCPYHDDNEWNRLKTEDPEAFKAAVDYEQSLTNAFTQVPQLTSVPYLHRSCVPLAQVDFGKLVADKVAAKLNHFGNECEGMCGV